MSRICVECRHRVDQENLAACPECGGTLTQPGTDGIPTTREELRMFVRSKVWKLYKKCGRWALLIITIITLIVGGSLLTIYRKATKKIEAVVIQRVEAKFQEPEIRRIVQEGAAAQANEMLKQEILPAIQRFKEETRSYLQEVEQQSEYSQSKFAEFNLLIFA